MKIETAIRNKPVTACSYANNITISDGGRFKVWFPDCKVYPDHNSDFFLSAGNSVTLEVYMRYHASRNTLLTLYAVGLEIVYLTRSQGYVEPRDNPYGTEHRKDMWLQLCPPSRHVALLSVQKLKVKFEDTTDSNGPVLEVYGGGKESEDRVWGVNHIYPPRPELLDTRQINVHFTTCYTTKGSAFSLLFSYLSQEVKPRRVHGSVWNCSVPEWPEFQRHFLCNVDVECDGAEDESSCSYWGRCGQGYLTIHNRCYQYFYANGTHIPWWSSNLHCQQHGGYLASLNSPEEWRSVVAVLNMRRSPTDVHLGLYSTPSALPLMYRDSFMWADKTIAYYLYSFVRTNVGILYLGDLYKYVRTSWFFIQLDPDERITDFLCEVKLSSLDAGEKSESFSVRLAVLRNESLVVPTVECPTGHLTHAFLACDERAQCWSHRHGLGSSETHAVPPRASCPAPLTSLPAMFACSSGFRRVPYSLVCDHKEQCDDGSDESFCVFPACSGSKVLRCHASTQCLPVSALCNGHGDCRHDTDEMNCEFRSWSSGFTAPPPAIVDFTPKSPLRVNRLPFLTKKLPQPHRCPETHFQCSADGYCLPVFVKCNGVNDCPGGQDEVGCVRVSCPGFYRCRSSAVCLHPSHVCDGKYQCPELDDELFCRLTCPAACTCHGLDFTCRHPFPAELHANVRYLDASGSGLTPGHLSKNIMLVHLSLSRCGLRTLHNMTLPNLRSLDLSRNELDTISADHLEGMLNLQYISLGKNPIKSLFPPDTVQRSLSSLTTLDISGVRMNSLTPRAFSSFPGLQMLNLSQCGVDRVLGDGFGAISQLRVLDAVGCPMTHFSRNLLLGLDQLQVVLADNFKFCCPNTLPPGFNAANCKAPFDEVSSCEALLRSQVYRLFLSAFSSLALLGNLGCFLLRNVFLKSSTSGFGVFVSHLSVSDFLMGVYLAFIGVADRLYKGSYVWADMSWRHSPTCSVAGFLSLLSNEVSAIVICLITLDRFLVLRFPFSSLHFKARSAHVTCAAAWVVGIVIAAVPLAPMTSHWSFYSQLGICIPLPVNRGDFAGRHYAFGILIIFNFVLFLLIAAGQAAIYISVRANSLQTADSTKKVSDLRIARRLISVAVSDFLCWFPIGLLGLLASRGVPISSEINVGMAILVLPLNSALNPFLYTVNVMIERRMKSRDQQLLKQLLAQVCEEEYKGKH